MKRVIVTGANGVGKSHFAKQLHSARPDVPVISFDALKLETNWQRRARADVENALTQELERPSWILEGGPSLLPNAIAHADALIWLNPPEYIRAWRLLLRPWKHVGQTRPELPTGNVDWPLQQYRFAYQSIRKRTRFQNSIAAAFNTADGVAKWHCRNERDRDAVVAKWLESA